MIILKARKEREREREYTFRKSSCLAEEFEIMDIISYSSDIFISIIINFFSHTNTIYSAILILYYFFSFAFNLITVLDTDRETSSKVDKTLY